MNLFFILLLIALIAVGYYVYQRLLKIEREIRADQRALIEEEESPTTAPEIKPSVPESLVENDGSCAPKEGLGVKEQVILAVEGSPGLTQTELYQKLHAEDRRGVQKLLRELDHSGQLRREKEGSSYRLYPL